MPKSHASSGVAPIIVRVYHLESGWIAVTAADGPCHVSLSVHYLCSSSRRIMHHLYGNGKITMEDPYLPRVLERSAWIWSTQPYHRRPHNEQQLHQELEGLLDGKDRWDYISVQAKMHFHYYNNLLGARCILNTAFALPNKLRGEFIFRHLYLFLCVYGVL
jgi:hypothetical protein